MSDGKIYTTLVRPPLSDKELNLIKTCRASGLFDIFARVVTEEKSVGGVPRDMERFLITFFSTAIIAKLPPPVLRELIKRFPGRIEFWKAQGIGAIVSNGKICRFVSMRAFNLAIVAVRDLANRTPGKANGEVDSERFRRTSVGYVPPDSRIFIEALRHCAGDRGREMRDVPLGVNRS